jgi:tricorn protease
LAELFTVGLEGDFEERVPLPVGFEGAYSPDGKSLAYVPVARAFSAWKRYRGGMAAPIWIARLSDGHVEKIPRQNSNDYNLLWIRNKIYFLSDRDGPVSLFCYDTQSKQVRKVLENDGLDLKSAGAGPDAIAYEQFGSLHLYDLKSRKAKPVPIRIAGDLLELREHLVNVSKRLHNAHLSPSGARAVFEAHGEILTLPAEKGDLRNLTNTLGVMERDPIWSPDGKTIAYFSDESGEYALQIRNQSGMGEVVKIPLGDKPGFYLHPVWSPDGKKIAYLDSHLALWYVDLDRKKAVKVDKDRYYPPGYMAPNWSPDSKWLVYSKRLPNYLGTIYLYSVADGKSLQVTDGMSDAQYPVFDKDGKYLYFTASTDSGASLQPDIHSFTRPVSRTIYLTVLAKDLPSPLGPESDEEKAAVADKSAASESPTAEAENETGTRGEEAKPEKANPESGKSAKGAAPVKIDVENISQRILALPLPARRYINLQIGKTGGLYATEAPMPGPGTEPALTVHRFDLSSRKSDVAIGSVRSFEISRNGEKMLYRQGDRWVIAVPRPMAPAGSGAGPLSAAAGPPTGAAGGGPPGAENTLKTDSIEVRVDPKAEWRQMYGETWRIERDFFYDPNLHGLDLTAAEEKYRPYLESVASRRDLT